MSKGWKTLGYCYGQFRRLKGGDWECLQHTKYSKSGDTRLLVYEREGVMAYRVDTIFSYKLLEDHPQRLERRKIRLG